ncbi:MAG: hypothetical protein H0T43_09450, partial [Solirubrobacterales bacterium]|nr:hypothetical protein [Solirubrobacterales bacterium]
MAASTLRSSLRRSSPVRGLMPLARRAGCCALLVSACFAGAFGVVPAMGAGPQAPPSSKALSSEDPDFAAGQRRDQARRDRREGAEAKQERKQSRTRYHDATRTEALSVGRVTYPDEFTGRLFDGRE